MGLKVKLVSSARHNYGGRTLSVGDEFEATEQDAEDLIALHFATRPQRKTLHVKREYKRRDMKAEE
jgi:uncharacterized protein (DUF1330 family)